MKKSSASVRQVLFDLASIDDAVLSPTKDGKAALRDDTLDAAQRILLERIDGFRSLEQILAMSGDLTSVHGILGSLMAAGYVVAEDAEEDDWVEAASITAPPVKAAPAKAPPAKPAAPPPAAPAPAKAAPTPAKPAPPPSAPAPPPPPKAVAKATPAVPAPAKAAPTAPSPAKAAPAAPTPPKATPVPTKPAKAEPSDYEPVSEIGEAGDAGDLDPAEELANAKKLLLQEAKHFLGPKAEKLRSRIDDTHSIEEIYDLIIKIRASIMRSDEADPDEFLEQLIVGMQSARKKKPAKHK